MGLEHFRLFTKFRRDRRGSVAIESAILAPPFLGALLFSFELLTTLFVSIQLDKSLRNLVDDIRFGLVQSNAFESELTTEEYYKEQICLISPLSSCSDTIQVDVEVFDQSGGRLDQGASVVAGSSNLVYVTVSMESPFRMFLGRDGNPIVLRSAQIFMTEPF